MGKVLDLTGQVFGRLTVVSTYLEDGKGQCVCQCECGTIKVISTNHLRFGGSRSCGCGRGTHRMKHTKEYGVWSSMKSRCFNKNNHAYHRYGGRGIYVCEEWMDFRNFYNDMGDKPDGMSLDRIDVNECYCKDNCRWATSKEQMNNRRNSIYLCVNGATHTLKEWSIITSVSYFTLNSRYVRGWSADKIVNTPARKYQLGLNTGVSDEVN